MENRIGGGDRAGGVLPDKTGSRGVTRLPDPILEVIRAVEDED